MQRVRVDGSVPEADAAEFFDIAMSEHEFMGHVMAYAKATHWPVAYHTHISKRSSEGWPDLTMVRNGVTVYAELKREKGGRLSDAQKAVLHELAVASHRSVHSGYNGYKWTAGKPVVTPAPWEDQSECWPPMSTRLVQVYLWKPSDWRTVEAVLR